MRDKTFAYMAGLMDGEGHIALTKSRPAENALRKHVSNKRTTYRPARVASWQFTLNIGMTSTDERLIKWVVQHFGGVVYTDKRQRQGWKRAGRWRILGRESQKHFLLGILPYLVIKREQASIALSFIEMGGIEDQQARLHFFDIFAKLNRRGESPETNTPDTSQDVKIESGLYGDVKSVPVVIQ